MAASSSMNSGMRAITLILSFCLLASGCSGPDASARRDASTLVRLADDEAKGLDPQKISDLASLRISVDQFEGLTRMSAAGEAEPALAEAPVVSADGLIWRYRLKPDMQFSDGHPIDAALFGQVFERLQAKDTASPTAPLFETIANISAVGPRDVVVTLRHAYPALGELLAHPALGALPLHLKDWPQARPMVTSGAYRLRSWALNDHILLEANPRWHGGKPLMPKVRWQPVSDTLSAMRLFQAGGADTTGDFPSARVKELRKTEGNAVRVAPYRGAYYFAFNTRKPPFNDVRVRRALHLATDRRWIAGPLMGIGTLPAWGVIPPGTTGLSAYQPSWADWPKARRMAEAAALLKQAGYGPDRPLVFDVRFNSDTDHRRVAVSLSAMWAPLGVEARLFNSESSLHFASLRRADFALARSGWIGDVSVPENFLAVHLSDSGAINYSGYANPAFDAALKEAEKVSDAAKRAALMRRAEAVMMEDAPILPLYFYVSRALVSPRVAGWTDNAANMHPSRTLGVKK
jgi:oligopeptide transport system substrate-binding protein